MTTSIDPYETLQALHQAATDAFCELVNSSLQEYEVFTVSLSGGSTPRKLYQMLAERDLPWDRIHWFWGDERNVATDHDESNYRMVRLALLDRVPIPRENIHGVNVKIDNPVDTANSYDAMMREFFDGQSLPIWDLALLGMGDDAHTASLFPQTTAITEMDRWFVENWVEKFDAYRYTLTAPAINSARQRWFLVAGRAKQDALARVLGSDVNPTLYPSQLIHPTRWFVTADAIA